MKKFASVLRSVLFTIAMISGLAVCISRTTADTSWGLVLALTMFGSAGLYLIVSFLSVVAKLINRARTDKRGRMIDSFTGAVSFQRNARVLNYFRQLSMWGTLMLFINIAALGLTSGMVIGGPYSSDIFLFIYHGFLLWSLLALIVSFVFSILFWIVYMPHYGENAYGLFTYIGKIIAGDFICPFRIIRSFVAKDEKKKVIGMITMVAFIAVNVIAIMKSV